MGYKNAGGVLIHTGELPLAPIPCKVETSHVLGQGQRPYPQAAAARKQMISYIVFTTHMALSKKSPLWGRVRREGSRSASPPLSEEGG